MAGMNIILVFIGFVAPVGGAHFIAQFIQPSYVSFTGTVLICLIPLLGGVNWALSAFLGRQLATLGFQWREALIAGLIGSIPFWSLSLLGYAIGGYTRLKIALGTPDPAGMLPTGVAVFSILGTLLLLASMVSMSAVLISNVLSKGN